MRERMKRLSAILVLVFMLQSILMSRVYAEETANVVMEISVPQLSLTGSSYKSESVELVWTSTDNSIRASAYDVYRDNSLIKTVENFSYTDSRLSPQTKYTYAVKAKNSNGEVIAESNMLPLTTSSEAVMPDTAAMLTDSAISIEQPGAGKILKLGNADFKTDRFIVKYKNENGKISVRKAFETMDAKTNIFDNEFKKLLKENKQNKGNKYFTDSIGNSTNRTYSGNNYGNGSIEIVPLNQSQTLKEFTAVLEKNNVSSNIEYIQPDYQLSLSSNDTYYSRQWGLKNNSEETKNNVDTTVSGELKVTDSALNIQTGLKQNYLCDAGVPEAWEKATGKGVTVAVIDTGIDTAHEDLSENIWANEKEIPGNGLDDDGNGKIDDVNGWDFTNNSNIVCDNTNLAGENHGTHLAGIISAVKDNQKGIAGGAPSAKIMPLKVFNNGKAYTSDIINAIQYAQSMGAKIVNCSWGSTDDNLALKEVIQNSGMLFVCAAGNSSVDIDSRVVYPAAFDCSNIITVASINQNGQLSGFSNYGVRSVDVAAPGEGIISTLTSNTYGENSGTSMAAAFVSGEAALLSSYSENMSAKELKERIIKCSNHLSSLNGRINQSAKINCINSINNSSSEEIINIPETTTASAIVSTVTTDSAVNTSNKGYELYGEPVNKATFEPWCNNGAIIEDVSATESGPIVDSKTWKFTKTDSSSQWCGWQGNYNRVFNSEAGDVWTISGYYKTSNTTGLTSLHAGYFAKPDWSSNYNTTIIDSDLGVIPDGKWHYFYCKIRANEEMDNAIIDDGPSWWYSSGTGTLLINGLKWEKSSYIKDSNVVAIEPGGNNGSIVEDVSVTEPGPVIGLKTWKFTKTGTRSQWCGWQGNYGGIFNSKVGDVWTISGYYKTSNAAGLTSLHAGYFAKPDWSSNYNTTIIDSDLRVIPDGKWHYFYCMIRANEEMVNPIVEDGPSWEYSNLAGTLYINGLQWVKAEYPIIQTSASNKAVYDPFCINGSTVEDVSASESGPISSLKTWKFAKTDSSSQWCGWQGNYNRAFNSQAGDVWTISGFYKTSNTAGLTNLHAGYFAKSDWSSNYNTTIIDSDLGVIPDGKWHYFYCKIKANEEMNNAIIDDGPSWWYSSGTGTLYINGLQWVKEINPQTKTSTITTTAGKAINLTIKPKNMKSLSDRTFTITYNPSDISAVTDLCKLTYKKETTTGTVSGTGITILKNEPGTIVFSVDKNIPDNKSWSGVANIIELKPAVSGQVTFTCKVE